MSGNEYLVVSFVFHTFIISASVRADCSSQALGLVSRRIKDHQITASSYSSDWTRPSAGRLLNKGNIASERTFGGWCAERTDGTQYLQIDLLLETVIKGVATQGMGIPAGNWVKKYALNYSCDGRTWVTHSSRDQQVVFGGNRDGDTVVKNHMIKPVIARLVRIRPLEWNTGGSICMRVELYGCVRTYGESANYEDCRSPIGLEDRTVKDGQISASSSFNDHLAPHARLNNLYQLVNGSSAWGAWCTDRKDQSQYLQVNLGHVQQLSGLATQGYKYGSWVTEYKVNHSTDGVTWSTVKDNGTIKIFSGNWDSDSVVANIFEHPIEARVVRVIPQAWYSMICLRLELYECKTYQGCTEPSTKDSTIADRSTSDSLSETSTAGSSGVPTMNTDQTVKGFISNAISQRLEKKLIVLTLIFWFCWRFKILVL